MFKDAICRALGRTTVAQWERLQAEGIVVCGVGTYGQEKLVVHEFRAPDGSWLGARLSIGSYCSIAPCEVFLGGDHRTDFLSQYPFRTFLHRGSYADDIGTRGDVAIGNDVWLGRDALILSGTVIGDGAVVGARAVVARDVRPYAVVVGNPAREVRRRFDDDTVERLLALRWWDWPEDKIRACIPMLSAPPASDERARL